MALASTLIFLWCIRAAGASGNMDALSLAGRWRFALDRADGGIKEHWFTSQLPDRIRLPGSLTEQSIGDDVTTNTPWTGGIVDKSWFTAPEYAKYREPDNVKVPFWLQPEKYYVGAAWYQRDIEIPKDWAGKRVGLFLERAHWETRLWVDGRAVGTNDSLSTPHEYDLGQLSPGKHTFTLRVDNRLVVDIGADSHSVTDHTQGNWNGIVGRMELQATPLVWIEDIQVFPSVATKTVTVKAKIGNATGKTGQGTGSVCVALKSTAKERRDFIARFGPTTNLPVKWDKSGGSFETTLPVNCVKYPQNWNEFNSEMYSAGVGVSTNSFPTPGDKFVAFGLRDISTAGTQFLVNGRKTFFRGTLECCIFPKTGYPPMDVESWKRIIRVCQAHGLNLIRFHSWCPPEAAFQAADEMGFYYQVEIASWANFSTTLGDGKPVDAWLYREAERILKAYGNHPSFVLMPYGNEPGGKNANKYLAEWVNHWKAADARRLYTSGAGWPQLPENQFHITSDPRIQRWEEGLKSRINAQPPETVTDYRDYIAARKVPVISHEIGQWCVYPNFDEIKKYTGYLKPKNFEIFRDSLKGHHMSDQAKQFLLASGKLQTLCYKEDIESALRTPGMGGFQLLDLRDFPGQGTALVGVLDPFWDEKGYVTAKEYNRFCNTTVPLARLSKRVFTTDEKLEADLEVAHFGAAPLESAVTTWRLVADDGKVVAQGELPKRDIPVDNGIPLGSVKVALTDVPAPARYKLVVGLVKWVESAPPGKTTEEVNYSVLKTAFENDWDIWVYPPKVDASVPSSITVVREFNTAAQAALEAGGKVLWLIPPRQVKNATNAPVVLGFSSIFWNTAWTGRQPPTTLGILCDPKHPLFAGFPTDFHSNWQWWYLIHRASPMILDELPPNLRPSVQVIDDWVTNRRLGLAFEAKVGKGRLLVCSIDVEHNLDTDPVVRQFRASLLHYMAGDRFKPAVEVSTAQIANLRTTEPDVQTKEN